MSAGDAGCLLLLYLKIEVDD